MGPLFVSLVLHVFLLAYLCNRVGVEAGRCRGQAVVDTSFLEHRLLGGALPGWLVFDLRTDHNVALLARLAPWERTNRHLGKVKITGQISLRYEEFEHLQFLKSRADWSC